MELPPEAISEFKKIYKEVYGETLSDAKASEKGNRLYQFYKIIFRPIPVIDYQTNEGRVE